ncbi:MAG: M28 family peptidase [Rhizobiales bacterium]|nr:M28 family peptidase [Hyphomicrobiales bacterium]
MLSLILAAVAACLMLYGGTYRFLRNPVLLTASPVPASAKADADRLKSHVEVLAASQPSRAFHNVTALNAAADYVEAEFKAAGCQPSRETFDVGGNDYHNIVCSFGPREAPRLIIGGHYDVDGDNNPGADDNASAVAGVLELARMIKAAKPELKHRLDLVAFTLEELPNFKTANMGSYFLAHNLAADNADVKLMISVEMIGFFADAPGSQSYPLGLLRWFYPDRGNFIGIVGQSFDRSLVARVKKLMQSSGDLPVYSINGPELVPGIDLSDHWSFWQHELPAVMVTDTAFFRNPNYHQPSDTPETLDYQRMAKVVDGLYQVAVNF